MLFEELKIVPNWDLIEELYKVRGTLSKKQKSRKYEEFREFFESFFDNQKTYAKVTNDKYVLTRNVDPNGKVSYQIYSVDSYNKGQFYYYNSKN